MTTQFITPPPHVWSRIEKILDEQEVRRNLTEKLISDTLSSTSPSKAKNKHSKTYMAAVAGISLLAGVIWMRM